MNYLRQIVNVGIHTNSSYVRTFHKIKHFHILSSASYSYVSKEKKIHYLSSILINNSCKSFYSQVHLSSQGATTSPAQGIQQTISTLTIRRPGRKRAPTESLPGQEMLQVLAFSTAEEYNLETLSVRLLSQGLYQTTATSEVNASENNKKKLILAQDNFQSTLGSADMHDVLHVSAKYQVGKDPREIYFFREGSVVFWNFQESEVQNVLQFLRACEHNSYDEEIIFRENEMMEFAYNPNATRLLNGSILLNEEGTTDLEKYAFSNAMALSVKLAIWESSLDTYVDSIEWVLEAMRKGKTISMTRQQVLQKTGELFTLRHLINLSSDLLDTPDFYWDRENLETLYNKTCNYLNIGRRTKVMNEKLNHCCELIELLSDHLNDKHHVRLEWMIIILIMVEVLFEFIHYAERFMATERLSKEIGIKED